MSSTATTTAASLTREQQTVLISLAASGGRWSPKTFWHYGGRNVTARWLETLVRRGYVARHLNASRDGYFYQMTPAGRVATDALYPC